MLAQLIACGVIPTGGGAVTPEVPDGYELPTPAMLKARYPAFAAVDNSIIQYWLTDALRFVDTSWTEGDYAVAIMAMAAHNMARAGYGSASAGIGGAAGVESFKSGGVSIQFSADAVKAAVAGGYASTPYGQEYADLLARNKGGPRVVGGGRIIGCGGFNGFAGPLPPWMCG